MPQIPAQDSDTLTDRIGELFMIGIPGTSIDDATAALFSDIRPGGICLFARNIKDAEETRRLTDGLRARYELPPLISIDQEGGLVDRLRRVVASYPSAASLVTVDDVAVQAQLISDALLRLGINMDLAPVVDVMDERRRAASNGLHSRTYGVSAADVAEFASEFMNVMRRADILTCLKHFPGLGAATVDSHEELPSVRISAGEFEGVDLLPYKILLRSHAVDSVMIAHAAYPELELQETSHDGKLLPSSLSYSIVTGLLRNKLGFQGVVVTDDLEMGAIVKHFGVGEAAVMAIEAGCDMVCICAGIESIKDAHQAILSAVNSGRLAEERVKVSLERVGKLRARIKAPLEFNAESLAAIRTSVEQMRERLA